MRLFIVLIVNVHCTIFKYISQSSVLLQSPRHRRHGEEIIDHTERLIYFDHDDLEGYIATVSLQKSIVDPDAVDKNIPLPRIFAGDLLNSKNEKIGTGRFQFQQDDVLTRFTLDDGHEDGRLHGELDINAESEHDEDLMFYREKSAFESHHQGRCARPLGAENVHRRQKRAKDKTDENKHEQVLIKAQQLENHVLSSPGTPRDCNIKIVADELFHIHVGKNQSAKTIAYMISVIDTANTIFRATNWLANRTDNSNNGTLVAKDFGFRINKIEIWNNPSIPNEYLNRTEIFSNQANSTSKNDYPQCDENSDICRYLKAFSRTGDHGDYCLAHLFTYKDFATGILGLAHIGKVVNEDSDSMGMGICAHGQKDKYNAYQNTALTTTLNWGKRILSTEADLVTVHELGHNWGAHHDNVVSAACEPGKPAGNYIMYFNAVTGEYENNNKFSPCSINDVIPKLASCVNGNFRPAPNTTCGNVHIEEDEECDPGGSQLLDEESECCTDKCKLKANAKCDDSNAKHKCCEKCQYQTTENVCLQATECKEESRCSLDSAICPGQKPKKDGVPCQDTDNRTSSCVNGKCLDLCASLSIDYHAQLLKENLHVCLCSAETHHDYMCARCCQLGFNKTTCQPAHEWQHRFAESGDFTPTWLQINSSCNYGVCQKDKEDKLICTKTVGLDILELINSVWNYLQPSLFSRLARNNIVGAVMIFSAIFWIPISILISYIDRKRKQHNEKTRFQWPDYMSSFQNGTYDSTYYQNTFQSKPKVGMNESYALQVMEQLTNHINQETVRDKDFQASPDFTQNNTNNNNQLEDDSKLSHQHKSHSKVLQKGLDARLSWYTSSTRDSMYGHTAVSNMETETSTATITRLVSKETNI